MGDGDQFFRNVLHQLLFRFQGCLAIIGQADPVGDTEYVRIHRHGWLVIYNGCDYVRSFSSYTRKFL